MLNVYDLKTYYAERQGRLVRRILAAHIQAFWPDMKGLEIVGYGYAAPYLRGIEGEAGRVAALMPESGGAHRWPESPQEKGKVSLVEEGRWPLASESVDRLILVHALEQADEPGELLSEAWRVLKSNGRMLVIFPRRMGLWARADWTPFGHGTPYTSGQITRLLQGNGFVRERAERALFMPPFRSFAMLRMAYTMEAFGKFLFPGLAGAGMIEASKQIYLGRAIPVQKGARYRKATVGIVAGAAPRISPSAER